jgi:hypothetical protein
MTQEDIIKSGYQDWLKHPITQTMLKRFQELRANHVQESVANAYNMSVDDKTFRLSAYAVKTIDRLVTIVNEPNTLIPTNL